MTRIANIKLLYKVKVSEVMKRMCASLKFIILGVTRVANIKSLYKVKVLEAMKMCNKLEIYYSKCD